MSYQRIKNTGIGAVNLPFCGRHVKFDDDGNYEKNTKEYLLQQNQKLKKRNAFLEQIYMRACFEDDVDEESFNMSDYVYC